MRRLTAALGALCVAVALAVCPAAAQSAAEMDARLDTLFGEHESYRTFFETLQKAVASNDREAVAAMVDYPFRARIGGEAVLVGDEAGFVADYERLVTPQVRNAIAGQTYETLFANWQGVSIGDGEIWFSGVGESGAVRIIAIND